MLTLEMALAAMARAAVASVSSGLINNQQHSYSDWCQTQQAPSLSSFHFSHASHTTSASNTSGRLHQTQQAPSLSSFHFSHASHTTSASNTSGFGGFLRSPSLSHNPANAPALPCIEEVRADKPTPLSTEAPSTTISTVLLSTNFVLETEDPDSEDEVSLGPIIVPNLILHANVWGKDKFPIAIECMIDNGAQLVLIRPEIVANLGLHIKKLFKLIHVTLTLNGESINCLLENYVSLQLSSSNNAWSSHPVRALITARLCSDILLGLPWLTHNNIIVDHNACTVIDKKKKLT